MALVTITSNFEEISVQKLNIKKNRTLWHVSRDVAGLGAQVPVSCRSVSGHRYVPVWSFWIVVYRDLKLFSQFANRIVIIMYLI